MSDKKKSYVAYFSLVFVLCLSVFLFSATNRHLTPEREGLDHAFVGSELARLLDRRISNIETGLVNAAWRLLVYGSLGLWGLHLSSKIGFKGILNNDIKRPRSVIATVIVGIVMGVFFIGYDMILSQSYRRHLLMYSYSRIPSAIFTSIAEGIGCQILNMFSVVFLMWIFSLVVKSEDGRAKVFRLVAVLCAVIFAARHIESTRIWYSGGQDVFRIIARGDFRLIIGLYAPLSLVCTYFLRKYGLLSAIAIHFICDIMWRVGWAWIQLGDRVFR